MAIGVTSLKLQRVPNGGNQLIAYWRFSKPWQTSEYWFQWQWKYEGRKDWVTQPKTSIDYDTWTELTDTSGKKYYRFDSGAVDPPTDGSIEQIRCRVFPVPKTYSKTVNGKSVTVDRYTGEWVYSNSIVLKERLEAPDPPTSLDAVLSGTKVRLTWSCTAPYATHVEVWRSANGAKWAKLATLTHKASGTYTDSKTAVGNHYAYRVRAYNGTGKKYSSYTSTVTIDEKPATSVGMGAKLAAADSVRLDWTFKGNVGKGVRVYYTTRYADFDDNSSAVQTMDFDVADYGTSCLSHVTVPNLEGGHTWYFRVKVFNDSGFSYYVRVKGSTEKSVKVTSFVKIAKKEETTNPIGKPTAKALYLTSTGALRAVFQLPESAIKSMTASGEEEQWELQFTTDAGTFQTDSTTNVSVEDGLSAISSKSGAWAYGSGTGWTAQGRGVIYDMESPKTSVTYRTRARRVRGSTKGSWSSVLTCAVPESAVAAPATPTLYGLRDNGGHLQIAFGNAGAKSGETSEIQIATVDTWETDAITSLSTNSAYGTLYVTSGGAYTKGSGSGQNSEVGRGLVYTWTGSEAGTHYWVRVRRLSADGTATSSWSSTLDITMDATVGEVTAETIPTGPTKLYAVLQQDSDSNVSLTWTCEDDVVEAASYEVQWTSNAYAFSSNAAGDIEASTVELTTWDDPSATMKTYTVTGLTASTRWYFRVRKVNEIGVGPWATALANGEYDGTEVTSYQSETSVRYDVPAAADVLDAPTTVPTQSSYESSDVALLAWAHNSASDSDQTAYEVDLTAVSADGEDVSVDDPTGTTDSACSLDLSALSLSDGTTLSWRVRTQGAVEGSWSPWSGWRSFVVYAAPTTGLAMSDAESNDLSETSATKLPITISLTANGYSAADAPVEWWASVIAAESYSTDDEDGDTITAGQAMWSGSVSASSDGFSQEGHSFVVSAKDAILTDGIAYTVRGGCVTAQGIRSEAAETGFSCAWEGFAPSPSAGVYWDSETLSCTIWPTCSDVPDQTAEEDPDTVSAEVTELPADITVPSSVTDEGSVTVTVGETELSRGELWHLDAELHTVTVHEDACDLPATVVVSYPAQEVDGTGAALRADTTLSVYRIEADGTPVELANGIANDGSAEVLDPHPTLGTCTYRVVATDGSTSQQGSYETEVETEENALIIQWDDETLRLPYDVKVSESYSPDVVLRSYAGRPHPVSYYGTARGQGGNWSSNMIKILDAENREKLRRLMAHMAPAYVREPAGIGYWAYVKAEFGRSDGDPSEGVSLTVTRVEVPAGEVG